MFRAFPAALLLTAFGLSPGGATLANDVTICLHKNDIDLAAGLEAVTVADLDGAMDIVAKRERSSAWTIAGRSMKTIYESIDKVVSNAKRVPEVAFLSPVTRAATG